jgi:hypothetical protein
LQESDQISVPEEWEELEKEYQGFIARTRRSVECLNKWTPSLRVMPPLNTNVIR